MTAPDPDPNAAVGPVSPQTLAAGQRALAAIVFTDAVGFSRMMSMDEDRALRLLARDIAYMKTTCEAFGGQVLKSTGDGLLMLFNSAVQAVACSLEIQRDLQKQNFELPKDERMVHRIGIHLGDVFQHGGDVMGDGVNIAARLQTEAVPGGICLSQTVYDVVRNRLPFYVNNLGARTLKNIGKVTAYQISPAAPDGGTPFRIAWYRWRPLLWGAASLAALTLTLCIVFYLGMHRQWATHHKGEPGSFTLIPVTVPVVKVPASAPAHAVIEASSTPASVLPATSALPTVTMTEATNAEAQNEAFHYMLAYDFEGMEKWIKGHDWPGKSTDKLAEACPRLNHLVTWTRQQLQRYTAEQPLKVVAKERTFYYWPAPFGGVRQKIVPNGVPPNSETKYALLGPDQIQPMAMLGIIRQLLKDDLEPADASTIELEKEMHLFIETYHLVLPNRTTATGSTTNAVAKPGTYPSGNPSP